MAENAELLEVDGNNLSSFYDNNRVKNMLTMASQFAKSGALPKSFDSAEKVYTVLQTGFEMGLAPMESMSTLYIVNGKITPYGTFWAKKLRQHGWKIKYEDKADSNGNPLSCNITIKKGDEEFSFLATRKMIAKGKAQGFAPMEKLRYHALSRLVQFDVPEIMPAGMSFTEDDLPPVVVQETPGDTEKEVDTGGFAKSGEEKEEKNEIIDAVLVEDEKENPEEPITEKISAQFQNLGIKEGSESAKMLISINTGKEENEAMTAEDLQKLSNALQIMIEAKNSNL